MAMTATDNAGTDFGANSWLVDEMYERYREDPTSVSDTWQEFFSDYKTTPVVPGAPVAAPAPAAPLVAAAVAAPLVAAPSAPVPAPAAPSPRGEDGKLILGAGL